MLDLVTHDDAQPTLPTALLEGHVTSAYGEPAELIGEFEQARHHDGKALVPRAGDYGLPALLAYLPAGVSRPAGEAYTGERPW